MGGAALFALAGLGGCGASKLSGFDGGTGDEGPPDATAPYDGGSFGGGFGNGDGGAFGSGDGSNGMKVASLYFNPPMATVLVTSRTPPPVPFTLMAKPIGGGTDFAVTPDMAIFTRADLAAMQVGNPVNLTPTGHVSGNGVLQGLYGGAGATATLNVTVHLSSTGTGVDPSAPGALDGATAPDPSVSALLYPYDKTVFPLGLVSPLVMWNAPKAGDVYRLHYEEKDFACDDYEVIATPAQQRMPQDCWDWFTSANQGDPVQVTLSRWDSASKTAYVSAKQTWTLAKEAMQGAIYYWTTSGPGDAYLARLQTGAGATPQQLTVSGQQTCMACHAVSKDGRTLVAVAGDDMAPSPAFPGENVTATPGICATPNVCQETFSTDYRSWVSFGLPSMPPPTGNVDLTPTKLANLFGGNVAVSPDGKYTVFGDVQLYLADTASGMYFTNTGLDNIALDPGNVGLMMPAFSPDGNHLIAVEGTADPGSQGQPSYITLANNPVAVPPATMPGTNAELVQLDFNAQTHTFSNPKRVLLESALPGGQQAIAYPTYSPDSSWVAFHAGDKPTACEGTCDQTETSSGALYLQSTNGGAPVRLAAVTDTPTVPAAQQNRTFEPTFNPIERGGYFWVVVSNERDWGNRISAGTAPANANKRLWVAAIDKAPGSGDPSHPPFFVEGQDENRLNMRGFWALAECIATGSGTCTAGFQCCSGFCGPNGICVDIGNTLPTCTPLGGMCPMEGPDGGPPLPCCGAPTVQCISGTCQIPVSR